MRQGLVALLILSLLPASPANSESVLEGPPWQLGQHLGTGTREGVKDLVHDFIRAYNHGNFERLDELFPQEPGFEGYYAEPERTWEKGEDRSTLRPYFEERNAFADKFVLTKLRIQRERKERGWDFYFELDRRSSQKRAKGFYAGKGVADCAMSVWNMSRPKE